MSPDKYLLSQTKGIIGTGEFCVNELNNAAFMEVCFESAGHDTDYV